MPHAPFWKLKGQHKVGGEIEITQRGSVWEGFRAEQTNRHVVGILPMPAMRETNQPSSGEGSQTDGEKVFFRGMGSWFFFFFCALETG